MQLCEARIALRDGLESDNEAAHTLVEDVELEEIELAYKDEVMD